MTDSKMYDRGSVLFQRQGHKKDARQTIVEKKPVPKRTGCLGGLQALLSCDFHGCFAAVMGFPDHDEATLNGHTERQHLKDLNARCPAWDTLTEAKRKSFNVNAATSSAAKEYPGWVNQDACTVCSLPPGGAGVPGLFAGVYDGHGRHGHEASEIVSKRLPCYLALQEKDPLQNPKEAFKAAFRSVDDDVYAGLGPDVEYSGTTAVAMLIDMNTRTLHCANVGDSRAIIGRRVPDAKTPQWEAIALTQDQKPALPEEQHRIELCGGTVSPYKENGVPMGPDRVWESQGLQKPGLAVSRSLGDGCARAVGVIHEPVITSHKLHPDDKLILLGTDGVWDSLSNDQAVAIAAKFYKMPAVGVKALVEAVRREEGGQTVDDTTIVLICLD